MEKIRYFFRYQWQIPAILTIALVLQGLLVGPMSLLGIAIPFAIWAGYAFYWGLKKKE